MRKTIEFETELTGSTTLSMPPEIAAALPAEGKATVVVFVDIDPDDALWRRAAYQHFLTWSCAATKTRRPQSAGVSDTERPTVQHARTARKSHTVRL
jgi:hypothetical protein